MVSASDLNQWLKQAIARVNAGDLNQGRALLEKVLERDPGNDRAWLWLSGCVEDSRQRLICLQQALRANPSNQAALDGMKVLDGELVQASAPSLLESRLAAIGMGGGETDRGIATVNPAPESQSAMPAFEASPAAPGEAPTYQASPVRQGEEPAAGQPRKRRRWLLLIVAVLVLGILTCLLIGPVVLLPLLPQVGIP
jgi:tetratricopeptide (TPR) repeat protein